MQTRPAPHGYPSSPCEFARAARNASGRIAGKRGRRGINAAARDIRGEGRKAIEIGAKHLDDPLRKCARGLECFSPETLVMTGALGSEDADQTDLAWSDAQIVSLATDTDIPSLGDSRVCCS